MHTFFTPFLSDFQPRLTWFLSKCDLLRPPLRTADPQQPSEIPRVSVVDPSKPPTLLFCIQIRVRAFTYSQILASLPLVDFQSNSKRQPNKLQCLAAYLVVNDTSIWCWHRAVRRLGTSDWHCCPRWPWHPWICWRSWRGLEREKANQDWSFQLN